MKITVQEMYNTEEHRNTNDKDDIITLKEETAHAIRRLNLR